MAKSIYDSFMLQLKLFFNYIFTILQEKINNFTISLNDYD